MQTQRNIKRGKEKISFPYLPRLKKEALSEMEEKTGDNDEKWERKMGRRIEPQKRDGRENSDPLLEAEGVRLRSGSGRRKLVRRKTSTTARGKQKTGCRHQSLTRGRGVKEVGDFLGGPQKQWGRVKERQRPDDLKKEANGSF